MSFFCKIKDVMYVCSSEYFLHRGSNKIFAVSIAIVLKGSHSFTCTSTVPHTRSSAIGMSHTFLCLPSYKWYSFTDPGGMEGSVGLGGWLCSETVYLPEGR